jgi:hypothetical protein
VRAVSATWHFGPPAGSAAVLSSTVGYLRGRWRAERVITDFRSGTTGSFSGTAVFSPRPSGPAGTVAERPDVPGLLAYHERGELTFGGHRGPASRSLLYLSAADGSAAVLFADGRPFFTLDLRTGTCAADHPCGRDSYEVTVRVLGPDAYTESWRVRGPGKDYEMTTTLTRAGAAG